jgi:hypothetical protein
VTIDIPGIPLGSDKTYHEIGFLTPGETKIIELSMALTRLPKSENLILVSVKARTLKIEFRKVGELQFFVE